MSQARAAAIVDGILRLQRLRRDYHINVYREVRAGLWVAEWASPDGQTHRFADSDPGVVADEIRRLTDDEH